MVTDWVATKLLKSRVHDVVAQKVVHDVLALITYKKEGSLRPHIKSSHANSHMSILFALRLCAFRQSYCLNPHQIRFQSHDTAQKSSLLYET